jgi:DNA-binding transcriptional LysR family regulator
MTTDLNLLAIFSAVAEAGNFSAAAERLGLTRSAVSQGIRRLEADIGQPLFLRTTRSVRLTEQGAAMRARVSRALQELHDAVEEVSTSSESPRGLLRVAATSIAERFLSGPLIASFCDRYPEITLDVVVTDDEFDIVAAGFDAGIRLAEAIEHDMIAVPLTGDQKEVAVATPAYLARHGVPQHPRDLVKHRCIGWRPSFDSQPHRWEFSRDGQSFAVDVDPQITTNDMLLMIRTALADGGVTFGIEETFRPYLARGELVAVLQDWLPPFPGFSLFFPSRRTVAPKLRALIEHVRVA